MNDQNNSSISRSSLEEPACRNGKRTGSYSALLAAVCVGQTDGGFSGGSTRKTYRTGTRGSVLNATNTLDFFCSLQYTRIPDHLELATVLIIISGNI